MQYLLEFLMKSTSSPDSWSEKQRCFKLIEVFVNRCQLDSRLIKGYNNILSEIQGHKSARSNWRIDVRRLLPTNAKYAPGNYFNESYPIISQFLTRMSLSRDQYDRVCYDH